MSNMFLSPSRGISHDAPYMIYKLTKKISDNQWDLSGYNDLFDAENLTIDNFIIGIRSGFKNTPTGTTATTLRNSTWSCRTTVSGKYQYDALNKTLLAQYSIAGGSKEGTTSSTAYTTDIYYVDLEVYIIISKEDIRTSDFLVAQGQPGNTLLTGSITSFYDNYQSISASDFIFQFAPEIKTATGQNKYSAQSDTSCTRNKIATIELSNAYGTPDITKIVYDNSTGDFQTCVRLISGLNDGKNNTTADNFQVSVYPYFYIYLIPQSDITVLA